MQQYCKKVLPTEQEIVGAPLPATGLIASHPLSLIPNCGGRFKAGESRPAPETNQPLSTSPSLRSLLSFPPHARFIAWPCPPVSPLHRSNFLLVVIISRGLLPFPSAQRLPTLIRCASRPLVVGFVLVQPGWRSLRSNFLREASRRPTHLSHRPIAFHPHREPRFHRCRSANSRRHIMSLRLMSSPR
jgi:hypothetical protein